jgi:hypothetical protein
VRSYFWPFTDVQNGNQREVTTKCGEDSIWFPTSERQSFVLFVAFCYKDCFGKLPLRLRSAPRDDWMTVEAAVPAAKRRVLPSARDTPATTAVTSAESARLRYDLSEARSQHSGYFRNLETLGELFQLG